jgi:hypothetical protein
MRNSTFKITRNALGPGLYPERDERPVSALDHVLLSIYGGLVAKLPSTAALERRAKLVDRHAGTFAGQSDQQLREAADALRADLVRKGIVPPLWWRAALH